MWACRWERQRYCLDSESFRPAGSPYSAERSAETSVAHGQTISLTNITTVKRCLDPSLPPGPTIWIGLADSPSGAYFIAGEPVLYAGLPNGL
jgi:hypothetical protein